MNALTGLGPLVRFALRRDRVYLPVWVLAIVGLTYVSAEAVASTYDTPVERASYAVNIGGSPASVAMVGPPVALRTIGGILVYETSPTALLGVALMAAFAVVRHTRAEEDAGRTELLGSTVVSPHASLAAAVLVASGASLVVGLGITASFLAVDQPVAESLLYGAAIAALGVVFTGVAACASQLMTHSRGAIGSSLAVLALAFALRAVGDVGESRLSWLSPMGWSQQVRLFDDNRWWPLLLSLALTGLLLAASVVLEAHRDLGEGIVPPRPGPDEARPALGTVVGLAWRLQRGTVLAWVVGVLAMGLMFGSFSEELENMVEDNPTLAQYFEQAGGASLVDAFFATSMLLMAIGACGFAVASALRTRSEESSGRLEPVLATGVSRYRWFFGSLTVTVAGSLLVVAAGGFGLGVSYAGVSGDSAAVWRMTGYILTYLPATLTLVALAVLLVGWLPRASGVAWGMVALAFVIGWLGSLLDLPAWVNDLSPFTHTPAVPADDLSLVPLLVLLGITVAGVAVGAVGFRRRDIG